MHFHCVEWLSVRYIPIYNYFIYQQGRSEKSRNHLRERFAAAATPIRWKAFTETTTKTESISLLAVSSCTYDYSIDIAVWHWKRIYVVISSIKFSQSKSELTSLQNPITLPHENSPSAWNWFERVSHMQMQTTNGRNCKRYTACNATMEVKFHELRARGIISMIC